MVSLALIAIALPLLAWRCARHPAPVVEPQMLRLRTYRRTVVLCVFVAGAIFANFVMMPQFLGTVWNYSTFRVGMAIVPFSSRLDHCRVGWSRGPRLDEKWLLRSGITIMAAAMVWLAFVPDETPDYWTEFFPAIIHEPDSLSASGAGDAAPAPRLSPPSSTRVTAQRIRGVGNCVLCEPITAANSNAVVNACAAGQASPDGLAASSFPLCRSTRTR